MKIIKPSMYFKFFENLPRSLYMYCSLLRIAYVVFYTRILSTKTVLQNRKYLSNQEAETDLECVGR